MKINNLCLSFDGVKIFDSFSLEVQPNSICCIAGPSGCGKTTLLNCIAGLQTYDGGTIEKESNVSYVFQTPRLLPNLSVRENITVVPSCDVSLADKYIQVADLAGIADKKASCLSGGEAQRVSLIRAFSCKRDIVLMDEPFQSLDVGMANRLMSLFLELWEQNKKTVLWVTHDITELCLAADKAVAVSAKPMKILMETDISIPREKRNPENTKHIFNEVYSCLTAKTRV